VNLDWEVENAIAKVKGYKKPNSDQSTADPIREGNEMLLSETHKLINSVRNEEDFPERWKEYIIVPSHNSFYINRCSNYRGISLLWISHEIKHNILSRLCHIYIYRWNYRDHYCCFQCNKLLIRVFGFVRYSRNNMSKIRQYISHSETSRKPKIQFERKYTYFTVLHRVLR
jgi:hypothetical protein